MRRAPSRTSASRSTFSASCSGSSEATILNMRRTSLGRPSAVPGPQQPGGYAALLTPAPIHNFRLYLRIFFSMSGRGTAAVVLSALDDLSEHQPWRTWLAHVPVPWYFYG